MTLFTTTRAALRTYRFLRRWNPRSVALELALRTIWEARR